MKRNSRAPKRTSRRQVIDVVLTRDPGSGWWIGSTPTLAGAYGQGRTQAAAKQNLMEAVEDHLETYRLLGEKPPLVRRVHMERVVRKAS